VSILGTFSAGKSTFINHYLQYPLQETGTQAVDDKFTVICYTSDKEVRTLPGIALDADPRFPFYQMSEELERVAEGEGKRVDAYLSLKTCPGDRLRGTILIDSPGFDADAQRTATLRITDYIIDLSDLVLVFFDARHPEAGAMRDTLTHLVANTIGRRDSSKFMYILNQIDVTAREDNPEEVVGAWQRAIAQEGLTAGKFYCIYSPEAAVPIEDEALRRRFEAKRDEDLSEIHARLAEVGVERAYRIIAALEKNAHEIETEHVPQLKALIGRWRRGVLWRDAGLFGITCGALLGLSIWAGYWDGLVFNPPWWGRVTGSATGLVSTVLAVIITMLLLHYGARRWARRALVRMIERTRPGGSKRDNLVNAFVKNTSVWRSILSPEPAGWGRRARRQLQAVLAEADNHVQALNNRFANPSGEGEGASGTRVSGPEQADVDVQIGLEKPAETPSGASARAS
jgi:hypothetical protein